MTRQFILLSSLLAICASAYAGIEPSIDEVEKLNQALAAVGCTGGQMEKNSGDATTFAVQDSECDKGEFDFVFDKDFKILKKTKD